MKLSDLYTLRTDGVYEIDPAVMFPAIIERIKEVRGGEPPVELGESGPAFMKKYAGVKDEALDFALEPDFIHDGDTPMNKLSRALRADALAFAEDYFQRALSEQVGKGLRIHITRNEDWKR